MTNRLPVDENFWGRFQTAARDGVWIAFNWDGSAFVPFASELDAYRYAAGYGMTVKFARFGDEDWKTRPDERDGA